MDFQNHWTLDTSVLVKGWFKFGPR
ncbi:hypothetical protein XBJ2_1110005 [Xenorhabdus bovienii str. Jollieti]|uniref:Uncharacterized protein n=1 Tax=Xenorhabdus bovienii (strain SS-2004) TaxID=406818 RepID=D3V382_XENBS|nr:hypothetical protein XBJ1_2071 [Xenorhabdus bovienii SS-2004]CDH27008.1 hypothetical protein XBJ2_1110005 [Xenorhabdus bovienii str. Jollieti]